MEAVTGVVADLSWGAIVAIAIVLVLLIIVFFYILRQARRSSR
jgi:hypothetical protein